MPEFAVAVRRGCGTRRKGGIYAECGVAGPGEVGYPLEHFLVDPPLPISPTAVGLSAVGMRLIERDGVSHLLDWVGEGYYPDVAGFLEEVRRFGLSRGPVPRGLAFDRLTAKSRILLVHRKAWVEQRGPYYEDWRLIPDMTWTRCPKGDAEHAEGRSMCAGLFWQDISRYDSKVEPRGDGDRDVWVRLPSFRFAAALMPVGHVQEYGPAIFASFPIHRLAVVDDPEGKEHVEAMKYASRSALPVDIVEA